MPTRRLTGSRIREKRLDLGLKQSDVAEAVGISPSYLNLIEHNRRRIGGKLLGDLARVLGVEPALLTVGADSQLLDQMRTAAAQMGDLAEVTRAEELAARFPGWSALIGAQATRLAALEGRVRTLTDRMAYDPQLSDALHQVISSVTAIRSSASILVGPEQLDSDWQRRFHENIHKDSLRLAANSEALITYLEAPKAKVDQTLSPIEELEAFLGKTGFHLSALEVGELPDGELAEEWPLSVASRELLADHARQYREDARLLPLQRIDELARAHEYDPAAIAKECGASFATVLRRLAVLPPDAGHPPIGLATCDTSGFLTRLKPVPGFSMSRSGGSCPLWPIFGALSRPAQPIKSEVVLPGAVPTRFLCYAIALPRPSQHFDALPVMESTMIVLPDRTPTVPTPIPVGVTCRICPRTNCTSRREPAMVGLTL